MLFGGVVRGWVKAKAGLDENVLEVIEPLPEIHDKAAYREIRRPLRMARLAQRRRGCQSGSGREAEAMTVFQSLSQMEIMGIARTPRR